MIIVFFGQIRQVVDKLLELVLLILQESINLNLNLLVALVLTNHIAAVKEIVLTVLSGGDVVMVMGTVKGLPPHCLAAGIQMSVILGFMAMVAMLVESLVVLSLLKVVCIGMPMCMNGGVHK